VVWRDEFPLGAALDGALTAAGPAEKAALKEIVLTCLAITWLNPHVYLDTLFLIGGISTQFPGSGPHSPPAP
jgi:L-lysine exporter family protein LysE/ArgO